MEGVDEARVRAVLRGFLGPIDQLPPMYSAVKHQGERLYKLARQGIEVERQPRRIQIFALDLLACDLPEIELDVHCSKGTYVRTLAEDIGRDTGLRRSCESAAPHRGRALCRARGRLRHPGSGARPGRRGGRGGALDALLLPLDSALGHWPAVRLSADAAFYLQQGQAVLVPQAPTEGLVRLYDPSSSIPGCRLRSTTTARCSPSVWSKRAMSGADSIPESAPEADQTLVRRISQTGPIP